MSSHKTGCNNCNRNKCSCRTPSSFTSGHGLLKFFGALVAVGASFAADLADGGFAALPSVYPVAAPRTLKNLSARIDAVLPVGTITVQLFKNGSPVPGFLVVFPASSPAGTVLNVTTAGVDVAQGDTFNLRAIGSAAIVALTLNLTATIGIGT